MPSWIGSIAILLLATNVVSPFRGAPPSDVVSPFRGVSATQRDAAAVLAEMRQALGGDAALDKIQSLSYKAEGKLILTGRFALPMEPPTVSDEHFLILPGHYLRVRGLFRNGVKMYEGFRPDRPLIADERVTREAAAPDRVLKHREHHAARLVFGLMGRSLDTHPLEYSYAGRHESAGAAYDIVDARGWGAWMRLYIDATTHLPSMVTTSRLEGKPTEIHWTLSGFKRKNGLMWPRVLEEETSGTLVEAFTVTEWKINPKIDLRKFERR